MNLIERIGNELFTTSWAFSNVVDMDHKSVISLIRKYTQHFEKLGPLKFETESFATNGGMQHRKIALLSAEHTLFLCTLMRSSETTSDLFVKFIEVLFSLARGANLRPDDPYSPYELLRIFRKGEPSNGR